MLLLLGCRGLRQLLQVRTDLSLRQFGGVPTVPRGQRPARPHACPARQRPFGHSTSLRHAPRMRLVPRGQTQRPFSSLIWPGKQLALRRRILAALAPDEARSHAGRRSGRPRAGSGRAAACTAAGGVLAALAPDQARSTRADAAAVLESGSGRAAACTAAAASLRHSPRTRLVPRGQTQRPSSSRIWPGSSLHCATGGSSLTHLRFTSSVPRGQMQRPSSVRIWPGSSLHSSAGGGGSEAAAVRHRRRTGHCGRWCLPGRRSGRRHS